MKKHYCWMLACASDERDGFSFYKNIYHVTMRKGEEGKSRGISREAKAHSRTLILMPLLFSSHAAGCQPTTIMIDPSVGSDAVFCQGSRSQDGRLGS